MTCEPQRYIIHGLGVEGRHAIAYLLSVGAYIIGIDVSQTPSLDIEITSNPNFSYIPEKDILEDRVLFDTTLQASTPLSSLRYLRSPGIPPANPLYRMMIELGQSPTTPTGLWLSQQNDRQIITITGTKGKSTTASLTADLIRWCSREAVLFGNIGTPPLGKKLPRGTIAIVELSSYMLHDLPPCGHCHVVTNLFKEHTDWHGSFEAYKEAKLLPLRRGTPSLISTNVVAQLDKVPSHGVETAGPSLPGAASVIENIIPQTDDAFLIGETAFRANQYNDLYITSSYLSALKTAIAICRHFLEIPDSVLIRSLQENLSTWRGLESRQEIIPSSDGIIWVNDALATVPEATLAALHRWPARQRHLIIGGKDRGQGLGPLLTYCATNGGIQLYSFGPIAKAMRLHHQSVSCHFSLTLEAALTQARNQAQKGDVILFSPAAPSAPPHASYQTRADIFRAFARSAAPYQDEKPCPEGQSDAKEADDQPDPDPRRAE